MNQKIKVEICSTTQIREYEFTTQNTVVRSTKLQHNKSHIAEVWSTSQSRYLPCEIAALLDKRSEPNV